MSTLSLHRFNQLYLPAHWLCFQLFWLYRTLQHIDQHIIVKAAERNLPAARLRLGLVQCSCQTPNLIPPQPLALFLSPCSERQAERANHEQTSQQRAKSRNRNHTYFLLDVIFVGISKAVLEKYVMRQGGLPSAAIDGLPTGTIRGRGRPKLRWIDNVTKWSGRCVKELRRAAIERHQVMAATPWVCHHYNLRIRRPRTQVYAEWWLEKYIIFSQSVLCVCSLCMQYAVGCL